MKIHELTSEEMARFGATHRLIVDYTDLNGAGTGYGALSSSAAASTSGTLVPFDDTAAGTRLQFVQGYLKTPFDGGATSELTVAIGYDLATGTDKSAGFLTATSVHADATYVTYLPQEIADVASDTVNETFGTEESTVIASLRTKVNQLIQALNKSFAVALDVNLVWTSTGANLTALTTGELHLYFRKVDLTRT